MNISEVMYLFYPEDWVIGHRRGRSCDITEMIPKSVKQSPSLYRTWQETGKLPDDFPEKHRCVPLKDVQP